MVWFAKATTSINLGLNVECADFGMLESRLKVTPGRFAVAESIEVLDSQQVLGSSIELFPDIA